MFGRRRQQTATQAGRPASGYHTEAVVVGNPDVPSIGRVRRLFVENSLGMQGQSGEVVGYDRGDPANTLTADLAQVYPGEAVPNPVTAQARLGVADQIVLGTPTYADVPATTAESIADGSSYRELLRRRIAR